MLVSRIAITFVIFDAVSHEIIPLALPDQG
jgi:hypothetical protein